ncbi:cytochrome c oxidase subunit II [Nocardioides aurantiacus]|uniref:Cytochrome c oxidase subunit 2 n=1 Tax=Nocardioides aurantiacus TaxID=86796 RepID=A0A3N2CSC0_9ACTN|nr:cytochrome c oxidase subunit II [Nocardioides aurantiacus]ROR90430.1 cytochrome c oxidase subunit 2 [Nocardioides aurantiacus]
MSLQFPTRLRRSLATGLLVAVALVLSGCSAETDTQLKRLAMPEAATAEAPAVHTLWIWAWVAAMITGVLVWGLILYASFRYRRRSESEIPVQTRYNLPIEVMYTIAPVIMVLVFFVFTLRAQADVLKDDDNADNVVTVVGQQWSWSFNYNLGYDEETEKYEPRDGEDVVYDVGTAAEPPTLWLVKDQSVQFNLTSPDVIHSFWVPAFLFKMDVIPGRHNSFSVTPTREGTFEGRCAELCGVRHTRMLFNVKVVDQQEYDDHLASLAERGNTGPALGGAEVNTVTGLEPESNGGEE